MNNSTLKNQLDKLKQLFFRFKVTLFVVIVLVIYGFVSWRVDVSLRIQPNPSSVSTQSSALQYPDLSQATLNQINQLQNNSVSVQSLFNQARQNPFQE